MADESHITRSVMDGQTQDVLRNANNSPLPTNEAQQQQRAEAFQLEQLEKLAREKIDEIESNPILTREQKDKLTGPIRSAMSTGNTSGLVSAINTAISNTTANTAQQSTLNSMRMAMAEEITASLYPDFGQYIPEAQAFIRRQILETYQKSETFRAIVDKFDALPEAAKSQAISTQREQEQRWKALQNDPIFDGPMGSNAKKLIDDFDVFKSARFEKIEDLINEAKNGRSKDEVMADILRIAATEMAQQIRVGDAVVKDMLPGMDPITKKIFADNFPGNNGLPNMSLAISTWHDISMADRNKAALEFEKHGRDMSKLSPEHQQTMALFKVMSGASVANALQATTKMAQNIELEATLKDKEHDPTGEKRAAAIMKFMRENEGTDADRGMSRAFAKDLVELIDRDPSAFALLKSGEEKDLREIGVRIATHNKVKNADDFAVSYIRESRDNYYNRVLSENPPDWLKNDAVRMQEERKNAQEWVATSHIRSALLEANGVTEAEMKVGASIPGKNDAQITADTADFMKEYEKKVAQRDEAAKLAQQNGAAPAATTEPAAQAAPNTAAQPTSSAVATTAVIPPPGIDPKDIPPLRGVISGMQPAVTEQQEPKGHLVGKTTVPSAEISGQAF